MSTTSPPTPPSTPPPTPPPTPAPGADPGRRPPGARRTRPLVAGLVVVLAGGIAALVAPGILSQTDVPPPLPGPTTTTAGAPAAAPPQPSCGDRVASLRPSGPATSVVPDGSYMAEIRQRGRLRVGVDTSKKQFTSVDPLTGSFEGFDIDIAREVAAALFGSPDAIEFVAIPSSERQNVLTDDPAVGDQVYAGVQVDLVADTFTITCARREVIDYSSEYFTSGQRLLVLQSDDATSIADMGGKRVCAAAGSTSIDNINALPEPRPEVVPVAQQGDCLVLLQQGKVDGISTDEAILAGMAAQDPNVKIVGEGFSDEHYGLGLPPGHDEWVRYVNAVLEDVRSSGRWTATYDEWLTDTLGAAESDRTPPPAVYSD
ncbi:MAG TPA: glutamate ABC transporter substrate-binding protein [Acidimicrobiales bacterium]|nr:glutamate ABC transporter substrate-binding protein [Acidimicrobiales bacterium]